MFMVSEEISSLRESEGQWKLGIVAQLPVQQSREHDAISLGKYFGPRDSIS